MLANKMKPIFLYIILALFTTGIAADNIIPSYGQRLVELIDVADYDKAMALIQAMGDEIKDSAPDKQKRMSDELEKYSSAWFFRHYYSNAIKSLRSFQEENKMHLADIPISHFTVNGSDVIYKAGDMFGPYKILSITNKTVYVEVFEHRLRYVLPIK